MNGCAGPQCLSERLVNSTHQLAREGINSTDFNMSKTYSNIDVLTAARERIKIIFDEFEIIMVSFSGGKDSTVQMELALQEAKKRNRKIHALFIDLEAQYSSTIEQVEQTMLNNPYIIPIWICLPLNLRNAVSVFQPHWACWQPAQASNWVRELPSYECVISDPNVLPFWRDRMEFEEFIVEFPKWFSQGKTYASLVGIRSDESLNRYRAVMRKDEGKKSAWWYQEQEIRWGTVLHKNHSNIVSFYPIYDWRTEDVWKFIYDSKCSYSKIYDLMYLAGITLHEQRICQPYGDDQRKGLDLWAKAEPETWRKVLNRVSGVNFGAIYARNKMLGYQRGVGLPVNHTWKSYTFFLLASLPDVLRERYLSNFAVFLEWWQRNGFEHLDIYDDETQPLKNSKRKRLPSWRRLALAISKNDFNCKSLSIGAVNNVVEDVYNQVAAGLPVTVRKSVKPVYESLREQFNQYERFGIDGVTVDFPCISPERDKLKRKILSL